MKALPKIQKSTRWPWQNTCAPVPPTMPDGSAWPKITILTVSYNQAPYLEEALLSVVQQGYPNLEYIVIDGGSSDGSVEIIKRYEKFLTHWESKPDRGQADALNKGVELATGEIFNFINSDDCLMPEALVKAAIQMKKCDMLAGGVRFVRDELDNEVNSTLHFNERLGVAQWLQGRTEYYQQGVWLRTSLVKNTGRFAARFRYIFDQELMIRILASRPRVAYSRDVFAYFRIHNESKTIGEAFEFKAEHSRLIYELEKLPNRQIKKFARIRIRAHVWHDILRKKEISAPFEKKWRVFAHVLFLTLKDLRVRFSSHTFGFLRRLILSQYGPKTTQPFNVKKP